MFESFDDAIYDAIRCGDADSVRQIICECPRTPGDEHWAINTAIDHDPDLIHLLIAEGINVDVRDDSQNTVLMDAAAGGKDASIRILLQHGADVNARNAWWETPFSYACAWGHEETAALLHEHGADVNCIHRTGGTPLDDRVRTGNHKPVRDFLQSAGARQQHDIPRDEARNHIGPWFDLDHETVNVFAESPWRQYSSLMTHIKLDYANCLNGRVGEHGIPTSALDGAAERIAAITKDLETTRGIGWERWRTLPFEPMRSEHVADVGRLVDQHTGAQNLLVLGIGGSALGNIALQSALNPVTYNLQPDNYRSGPRLFVLDNVDPEFVGHTLRYIEQSDPGWHHTVVNVISKSGETAETAAQFMIARSILRKTIGSNYAQHIVAVTDPEKGTMRSICDAEGIDTLPVPEGVGGRFSVLSPVGLFSAAMCGIDINALLDGAAAMDERCRATDMRANPAAMLAFLLMELTSHGKPNHVLMPYSNPLYLLADWFRQLWAESLGKKVDTSGATVHAGATPIKALGTTDQHSQVQLYREGPNDKVIGFVEVAEIDDDVTIPSDLEIENLKYLHGATLGNLLASEKRATEYALVESQRPNFTLTLPRLDADSVGQFIQLWEVTTAYAGRMLNIDAYDQPAVETGKKATFGLMGRDGYGEWKQKVDAALAPTEYVIE